MVLSSGQNTLRSWFICILAALFFFYLVFQLAIFNTIGAELMRELGITSSTLGLLSAIYLYMCSLFFLPAGLLFDRFSTKTLLILASILCVIGTALLSVTSSIVIAFIGRILVGISNPFSFLGPMRLASRWFTPSQTGLVIGLIVTIGMSGGIVAQSPFALLMDAVGGWRHAMYINVTFGLLLMILMGLFIDDEPKVLQTAKTKRQQDNFLKTFKQICSNRQNWLCGLYTGLIGTPVSVLGALWGNVYLTQGKGYSPIMAGNLLSLIFLGLIIGPTIYGWSSDKIGRRKLPIMIGAMGILFCSLIVIYQNPSTIILAILLFMMGFFCGAQALNYTLVIESNPSEMESTSLGFISILVNLIGASMQIAVGWLINLHWHATIQNESSLYTPENFKFALVLLPIGFLISVLLSLFMHETFNKRMSLENLSYEESI